MIHVAVFCIILSCSLLDFYSVLDVLAASINKAMNKGRYSRPIIFAEIRASATVMSGIPTYKHSNLNKILLMIAS
jgi:hypothetical protein